MSLSNSEIGSDIYLFKPVNKSKNVCALLKANKKLSYSRARECIVKKLKLAEQSHSSFLKKNLERKILFVHKHVKQV